MEFNNRYYATLILTAPDKAKEYLANCQGKGTVTQETEIYSEEKINMMIEFCRSKGMKMRPNFKPETIEKKYQEAQNL